MRVTEHTTPEDLYSHLLGALRAWHSSASDHLLEFLSLVRERASGAADLSSRRRAANAVLLMGLEDLETREAAIAEILCGRFVRQETTVKISHSHNYSVDQVNRLQKKAVLQLAGLILARERALRRLKTRELEARLPAGQYSRLFGIQEDTDALLSRLAPGQEPSIIVLSGMGGIGKTALAHHLTLQLAPEYGPETVHWLHAPSSPAVSANPAGLQRLVMNDLAARLTSPEGPPDARRKRAALALKAAGHFVVVDNLETEAETASTIEQLLPLVGPSRFLLTTRASAAGQAGVHTHRMRELSFPDASELLRTHSHEIGLGSMAITEEKDLQAVYDAVGGNPLALKLVAGMTARFPLPVVLKDLGSQRLHQTREMYERVFDRAWNALSQDAGRLLEGMPLVAGSGAGPAQLLAFSGLPEERFWQAVNELISRSLLEVRGTTSERRYGIHQLTRAFLERRT